MERLTPSLILDSAAKRGAEAGLPYFGALLPREAHALIAAQPDTRIIDVRTHAEWDYVGRVPNSALVEWQHYPDMSRNANFVAELRAAVPDPSTPVIFLCRSGVRSHSAAAAAAAAGYTHAFNLLEGFEGNRNEVAHRNTIGGWRAAGLPWEQS